MTVKVDSEGFGISRICSQGIEGAYEFETACHKHECLTVVKLDSLALSGSPVTTVYIVIGINTS